jgi:glycosyltransferase involved in cell wall biosynthesis
MGRQPAVHQFLAGATPGDAIFDQAVMLRDWLRDWGYQSQIYAHSLHPSVTSQIPHFTNYRPGRRAQDLLIFHYSIGSELSEFIRGVGNRVLMVYHNITPPQLLGNIDPQMRALTRKGLDELASFRGVVKLALADSEFNRQALVAAGYPEPRTFPIILDESRYASPPDTALESRLAAGGPNVLFVGRIAPNKRQEDVIKAFCYYHLIEPTAQLHLVGMIWRPAEHYYQWLRALVAHLGLDDCVHFTDHVSFQTMTTYYRGAELFLCMSEHEGFGKPLIESMYFDVPIIAYSAAAIPYTLGGVGILIHRKEHPVIAELMHLLVSDPSFREQILAAQRRRYQDFLPSRVKALFKATVESLLES